jgi:RNA polymerase sigma factor (sigma-70 family)
MNWGVLMTTLAEILRKARRAVIRQGISDHDADELVHEAYLKVEQYQREHEVRSQEALLVRAAVNLSIDRRRRNGRMPVAENAELHEIVDTAPDPARILEARAKLRLVSAGLDRLPERTRRILLLRRLDNMSYADIAAREDMSVAAVEKAIARATLQLMTWVAQS